MTGLVPHLYRSDRIARMVKLVVTLEFATDSGRVNEARKAITDWLEKQAKELNRDNHCCRVDKTQIFPVYSAD